MSRLSKVFKKNKVFIPYITAGDPDLPTTEQLIYALEQSGADAIELGIPFSDPIADGPVIQKAHQRALKSGTTLKKVMELVTKVRKQTNVPLLFMMSINSVVQYGQEQFVKDIEDAGLDGLIVPDLPFESSDQLRKNLKKVGIPFINFIAPTTSKERLTKIIKASNGFIYLIGATGVTGMRSTLSNLLEDIISKIKSVKDVPVAVGFGISDAHMAKKVTSNADGVIVGSAIVSLIEEYKTGCIQEVKNFANSIKKAIS